MKSTDPILNSSHALQPSEFSTSEPIVSDTLDRLEHAFDQFQKKQEHRWNALRAFASRPVVPTDLASASQECATEASFVDFVKKGWMPRSTEHKALSQKDGEFLIPVSLQQRLHQDLRHISTMRAVAKITTIHGDHLDVIRDQKHAEAGWVVESQDRVETGAPTLQKITIPVHHLYAKPRVTQQLLDDVSMDLESWLLDKIAHQMAILENMAFLTGDGQGKPTGILNYPLVAVGQGKQGCLESIRSGLKGGLMHSDALLHTVNSLAPHYLNRAVWLVSRGALSAIRLLKEPGSDRYLWQPSLQQDMPSTLLGYPVHVCDGIPDMQPGKATSSIIFGNFEQGYQIVDRAAMSLLRDPFSAKPFVEFYANKRVGGDVVNWDAIKVLEFDDMRGSQN
jgi:HK97 family phage major capsid protein